ncbi:YegP family protein [Muricauda sp. SCSIO 64092]|uniref:YegP family protein n=1 Tax=Allomuricauda sp. SCSIO 64092 TaxID=2908842 RepID=UPI001FF586EF|nr:YegP family protein [Muricauda sp. SCSIO 64092]UOY06282.1 YegP family protein [Muricauda sp. SCSIO 64092]
MVEILKIAEGKFQLRIDSESGSPLLHSIPFKSESDAKRVLDKVIAKPIFERKTDHQGKFVITLKTATGENVGQSNTYSSEAGMENGIKNLLKSLSKASV